MRHVFYLFALTLFAAPSSAGKEFLTDAEIEKIQDAQAIDERLKIYMEAAALRLKTAEDRLMGKESAEKDPLEFFTPEDMLDGYYRILRSAMMNLDDAFQKPSSDPSKVRKALKILKGGTEDAVAELKILKKLAEEKQKEELWNLVNKAIDITDGAHEGAEYGLSKLPATDRDGKKNK
jgi:hypothetical protein